MLGGKTASVSAKLLGPEAWSVARLKSMARRALGLADDTAVELILGEAALKPDGELLCMAGLGREVASFDVVVVQKAGIPVRQHLYTSFGKMGGSGPPRTTTLLLEPGLPLECQLEADRYRYFVLPEGQATPGWDSAEQFPELDVSAAPEEGLSPGAALLAGPRGRRGPPPDWGGWQDLAMCMP